MSDERQIFGTEQWDVARWLKEYAQAQRSEAMDAEDEIISEKIMAGANEIRHLRAENELLEEDNKRLRKVADLRADRIRKLIADLEEVDPQ